MSIEAKLLVDCTGVLVAGGRGVRLGGIAKGLLTASGETIAARALALFRSLFAESFIVANDPAPYASLGARTLPDVIAGKGAPGGLYTALREARTKWIFTAACDMPFLDEGPIRFLAERRAPGVLAVMPVWSGKAQPLHALWSRDALPTVEEMIRAGDPSLQSIVRAIGAHLVAEELWATVDPGGRALENANTAADVARLGLTRP